MFKHSRRIALFCGAAAILFAPLAIAAPPGPWRFPFRLPVPAPLRIFERLRNPQPAVVKPAPTTVQLAGLSWHTNYHAAWREAKAENKMLLVLFRSHQENAYRKATLDFVAANATVASQLKSNFVLAAVPMDQTITDRGRRIRLIDHGSMQEMHGREGIAIIDLKHQGQPFYGHTVSAYPFIRSKYYQYRAADLPTIVDLPAGTITQRTMVWAVRVHPERPASTKGQVSSVLSKAAESHSHHQAQIGVQGHHQWETRFQRILGLLGGRRAPVEVVAESWPNQTMIDSCVDCVASWRQSSGHWNAVKSYQDIYGYDIKRGNNGIWYGTGIFAR